MFIKLSVDTVVLITTIFGIKPVLIFYKIFLWSENSVLHQSKRLWGKKRKKDEKELWGPGV